MRAKPRSCFFAAKLTLVKLARRIVRRLPSRFGGRGRIRRRRPGREGVSEEIEEDGFEEVPVFGAAGEEGAEPEVVAFGFVDVDGGEVALAGGGDVEVRGGSLGFDVEFLICGLGRRIE